MRRVVAWLVLVLALANAFVVVFIGSVIWADATSPAGFGGEFHAVMASYGALSLANAVVMIVLSVRLLRSGS